MCGQYTVFTDEEMAEIKAVLRTAGAKGEPESAFGELGRTVRPTDVAPVLTAERRVTPRRWGFGSYAGKSVIINARSETADTSRMFAQSARNGRAVALAGSYFEWMAVSGRQKLRFELAPQGSAGLYLAALIQPESGCYVVLTRAPTAEIAYIHDRMPLLLNPWQLSAWLDGQLTIAEAVSGAFTAVAAK